MLIYSFITDYQAFNLRYKDNTARDKNETKVGKQSANLGKNNEPIKNRLLFLIDYKPVILHHLTILLFPMVRPAWDNWWLYNPVIRQARLGVESEFSTKQLLNFMPLLAKRSMFGVEANLEMALPYALMACMAWSSHMIYRMLGRFPDSCEKTDKGTTCNTAIASKE